MIDIQKQIGAVRRCYKIQSHYPGSSELAVDGVMGPQTWGAIFTVMRDLLTRFWEEKNPGVPLPALTYGYNGKGLYPCGESFPVEAAEKDGYISKANRRVELVFYDKNKAPEILDPPSQSEPIPKDKCQVYDPTVMEKAPIKVEQLEATKEGVLKVDIIIDPSNPDVQDDEFMLYGTDNDYVQIKTVKSDKIPGDKKLTLEYTDLTPGARYMLAQYDEENFRELTQEFVFEPKDNTKEADVYIVKSAFRELEVKGEVKEIWDKDEGQLMFDTQFVQDKWLYIFMKDASSGKHKLIGEYFGHDDGAFENVNLKTDAGKDKRELTGNTGPCISLPLVVQNNKIETYACLSQIHLPWARIEQLQETPSPRCHQIGSGEGGVFWLPDDYARQFPNLLPGRDSRINDPGKDIVVVGLFDYIREGRRRAENYQNALEPYLQTRFDIPKTGQSDRETEIQRYEKYVGGLLYDLCFKSPNKKKFQDNLKDPYGFKSSMERKEQEEFKFRRSAEQSGRFLNKWIDDDKDVFDAVLRDYTADKENQELWDIIQEEYGYLVAGANATSLMSLYMLNVWENKQSWLNEYLLNENAFKGVRKTTHATVNILDSLSKVVTHKIELRTTVSTFNKIYGVWFKGIIFELFPKKIDPKQIVYFNSLLDLPAVQVVQRIGISKNSQPLKHLGNFTDSKLVRSIQGSIEAINLAISITQIADKSDTKNIGSLASSITDTLQLLAECKQFKEEIIKKRIVSAISMVSGAIDTYLALLEFQEEWADKDYDAAITKGFTAAGSAAIAIGSALCLKAWFAAGASLCTTGVGSPLGAAMILTGSIVVAASAVAYIFTNDSKLEDWISDCPYGKDPDWKFDLSENQKIQVDKLNSLLYSFTAEAGNRILSTQYNDYYIALKSAHFSPHTKILVKKAELIDDDDNKLSLLSNEILQEQGGGKPYYRIHIEKGNTEFTLRICWKSQACVRAHRANTNRGKFTFRRLKAEIQIDLNGNDMIILPLRGKFTEINDRVSMM